MACRHLKLGLFVMLLAASGCFNSESEYNRLVEEKEALALELAKAKEENDILNQALANIRGEQERLQTLLNVERSRVEASLQSASNAATGSPSGTASVGTVSNIGDDDFWVVPQQPSPSTSVVTPRPAPSQPQASTTAPSGSGKVYVTKSGDVLSSIAHRHNTTIDELLELNPRIKNRRNYMIHENEKINIP